MNNYLSLLICVFSFLILKGNAQEVNIHIKSDILGDPEVRITPPVDGQYFYLAKIDTSINKDGVLDFKKTVKFPGFYSIRHAGDGKILYLKPGDEVWLTFTMKPDAKVEVLLKGPNEVGQNLYETYKRPFFQSVAEGYLQKYKSIASAQEAVDRKRDKELYQMDSLFKIKAIDREFKDGISAEINTYYLSVNSYVLQDSIYKLKLIEDSVILADQTVKYFLDNWKNLVKNYDFKNPLNKSRNSFFDLLQTRASIEKYYFDIDTYKQQPIPKITGSYEEIEYNLALLVSDPVNEEYAMAQGIELGSIQENYDAFLIRKYETLAAKYPNSAILPYLKPEIDKIKHYQSAIKKDFSDKIKFVDNYDKITNFSEVESFFKDQLVYVDLWATWCGPCKDEFAYNDDLKAFADKNGITKLYISVDIDESDNKWKEMVKYYNLEGYHIRASKALSDQLREKFSQDFGGRKGFGIPYYLIIKNGEIVQMNAYRPSHKERLYNQLQSFKTKN